MYNLGNHFLFDINRALTNESNIVKGNKYRISVLTERLVRIEYNEKGIFEDKPTQFALNRDFQKTDYSIKQDDKFIEITTKYFKLEYLKESNFTSIKNLKIYLESTDKIWYYKHPEIRNYNSTYTSLDDYNKSSNLNKGLYSEDGFVTIDDSNSLIINNGILEENKNQKFDMYIFLYRKDFNFCLKDYFYLTGNPPLLPRYALGNWWSKNYNYSTNSLNKLFDRFKKEEIPISVLLLDKDWHIRNYENKKNLITGYTFNKQLIPNPLEFIKSFNKRGIRVGLYNNPIEGIHSHEEAYNKINQYFKVENNENIKFMPYNALFLDVYFKLLLHPLESIGVSFFWNDFYLKNQEKINFIISHYLYVDSGRLENKRNMLISRNTIIAPHRYGIIYSGKTKVSWNTLKILPFLNSNSSNLGISWNSHDIGGYHTGMEDGELYLRYVQFGCFSPIFRIHVEKGRYYKREPWRWDLKTFEITKNYMQLRHRLVPYIYNEGYKYYKEGRPLIQPLYYKNPELYDDVLYKNEYYFGSEFLVSPLTDKKDIVMDRVIHKFFLPKGLWYDFKSGKKFPGDRSYVSFFKDEEYPVFVRSGGIVTLSNDINNSLSLPKNLEIQIFPGKSNTYNLYEDDGFSNLYKEGYYLLTSIDYNYQENNYTIIIRSLEGKKGIVPEKRNYKIRFRNIRKPEEIVANFDGSKLDINSYEDENDFVLDIKDVPTIGQLSINCKGKAIEIDSLRLINEDIDEVISDIPVETVLKEKISSILFSNLEIKKKRIKIKKLKRDKLDPKFIKMFIRLLEYIEQI